MLELLERRRSIRRFTGGVLSDSQIKALVCAGLLAPSAKNRKPVELFFVRDRAMVARLVGCRDAGGDAVLRTLEVDDAIEPLVTAATMAHGQFALLVAPTRFRQADGEGLLRLVRCDLIEGRDRHEASAGRIRLKTLYCHVRTSLSSQPSKNSMVSPGASFTMAFL